MFIPGWVLAVVGVIGVVVVWELMAISGLMAAVSRIQATLAKIDSRLDDLESKTEQEDDHLPEWLYDGTDEAAVEGSEAHVDKRT